MPEEPIQPTALVEICHVLEQIPTHAKGHFVGGGVSAVVIDDTTTIGDLKAALIQKRYDDLNPPPAPPEE